MRCPWAADRNVDDDYKWHFLLSLLSFFLLILPEGVVVGFQNLACAKLVFKLGLSLAITVSLVDSYTLWEYNSMAVPVYDGTIVLQLYHFSIPLYKVPL